MHQKEYKSEGLKPGMHDIRRTAAQWVELINGISDAYMLFVTAESLACSNLVAPEKGGNGHVVLHMTSEQLAKYALSKYLEIIPDINVLMDKIADSTRRDLLGMQLVSIDLIVERANIIELKKLHIYLNAHRDFLPMELLRIKVAEVYQLIGQLADTQKMRAEVLAAVSGTIDSDT